MTTYFKPPYICHRCLKNIPEALVTAAEMRPEEVHTRPAGRPKLFRATCEVYCPHCGHENKITLAEPVH